MNLRKFTAESRLKDLFGLLIRKEKTKIPLNNCKSYFSSISYSRTEYKKKQNRGLVDYEQK